MAVELVNHCQNIIAPCLRHYMDGLGKFLMFEVLHLFEITYFFSHQSYNKVDFMRFFKKHVVRTLGSISYYMIAIKFRP